MTSLATARRMPASASRPVPAGVAAPGGAGRRAARPAPGFVRRRLPVAAAVLAAAVSLLPDAASGQAASAAGVHASSAGEAQAGNEIDRFMERVLENRDASWRRIGDFVLREVLTLDVDGPAGLPIAGFRREYEWYVREDVVVRSPRRFDGVDIGEAERREYEADWLRRRERRAAERREERRREAERRRSVSIGLDGIRVAEGAEAAAAEDALAETPAAAEAAGSAVADDASAAAEDAAPAVAEDAGSAVADDASAAAEAAGLAVADDAPAAEDAGPAGRREAEVADPERLEPEFITDAGYFLEFSFEPGNYYLAGYETLAGREVVKIEYYPTDLFDDDSEPESERERRIAEGFAKTSLVTLWIDPEFHEVVRYTFENVGLDFLPARWLVRVDGWHASIEMAQPIGGVWLPSRMILTGGATTALGAFEMRLTREYTDYREALTSGRVVGTGDVTGDRR
jgi:hypothetical protein